MVSFNFTELLKQPAMLCFLLPAQAFSPMLLKMLAIALSFVVVKGVVGQVRACGWHPAHSALAFTIPFVLVWNYTLMDRFLLPFLPIFLAGAYREVRWVLRATREVLRSARPRSERLVSVVMALGVVRSKCLYRQPFSLVRTGLCGARTPASRVAGRPQAGSLSVDSEPHCTHGPGHCL